MFKKFISVFLSFLLFFQNFLSFNFLFFKTSLLFAAEPICLQPQDALYPPQYNSASGYCETYPVDEKGNCPQNYVFSSSVGKCISYPFCEGNTIWDPNLKQCKEIAYSGGSSGEGFFLDPNQSYCAVDLNGDGDVAQNEIFSCIQTPQGMLCSYGQAECSAQYSPPTCPSGGSYNPSTGKCEANSTPMPINDIKQVVQHVSESRGYNPSSSYPVSITEDGRNMIWEMGWCTGDLDQYYKYRGCHSNTWTVTIVRPEAIGYAGLDILGGNDRAYFYINGVLYHSAGKCCGCGKNLTSVFRSMPPGTTVTLTITACDGSGCCSGLYARFRFTLAPGAVAVDCPSGYSYNPGTGKCEANPICSQGTFQNGQCFTGYTCPLGNYQCHQVNDKWMCSPYSCISPSQIQDDEPDTIPSGYQDDGSKDESGNCLASILIFNGFEMRCRPAGVQTGFQNCCDEAQGKLYDSTGSLSGDFQTVKDVVMAIAAAKQMVQIGYYGIKVAANQYALSYQFADKVILMDLSTGEQIAAFASNAPEVKALEAVEVGMASDQAAFTAMQNYALQLKADIALAIVNLATSQLIDDPVLAATVNLAATAALPYLFGMSVSPVGMAFAVTNLVMSLFMGSCDKQDIMTSTYKESGYCHYVGSKCIKKWPLVGCVQKAKIYCCFNSKLARIIHEQGRPQLMTFQQNLKGIWGNAKDPLCRGFTPDEFQALDFSQMDLSEYYSDIERNVRTNVETMINTQINETYQGLKK